METETHFTKRRISAATEESHNNLKTQTKRFQQQPKLCRLFFLNNHCSYGHSCRFLHSTPPSSKPYNIPPPHPQLQPRIRKFDCYSSAECRKMQTSSAAAIDGYSSAECRTTQTSTAATNASTSTVATSYVHKNEPYGVKCMFKKNELQKISRIYADWI